MGDLAHTLRQFLLRLTSVMVEGSIPHDYRQPLTSHQRSIPLHLAFTMFSEHPEINSIGDIELLLLTEPSYALVESTTELLISRISGENSTGPDFPLKWKLPLLSEREWTRPDFLTEIMYGPEALPLLQQHLVNKVSSGTVATPALQLFSRITGGEDPYNIDNWTRYAGTSTLSVIQLVAGILNESVDDLYETLLNVFPASDSPLAPSAEPTDFVEQPELESELSPLPISSSMVDISRARNLANEWLYILDSARPFNIDNKDRWLSWGAFCIRNKIDTALTEAVKRFVIQINADRGGPSDPLDNIWADYAEAGEATHNSIAGKIENFEVALKNSYDSNSEDFWGQSFSDWFFGIYYNDDRGFKELCSALVALGYNNKHLYDERTLDLYDRTIKALKECGSTRKELVKQKATTQKQITWKDLSHFKGTKKMPLVVLYFLKLGAEDRKELSDLYNDDGTQKDNPIFDLIEFVHIPFKPKDSSAPKLSTKVTRRPDLILSSRFIPKELQNSINKDIKQTIKQNKWGAIPRIAQIASFKKAILDSKKDKCIANANCKALKEGKSCGPAPWYYEAWKLSGENI